MCLPCWGERPVLVRLRSWGRISHMEMKPPQREMFYCAPGIGLSLNGNNLGLAREMHIFLATNHLCGIWAARFTRNYPAEWDSRAKARSDGSKFACRLLAHPGLPSASNRVANGPSRRLCGKKALKSCRFTGPGAAGQMSKAAAAALVFRIPFLPLFAGRPCSDFVHAGCRADRGFWANSAADRYK